MNDLKNTVEIIGVVIVAGLAGVGLCSLMPIVDVGFRVGITLLFAQLVLVGYDKTQRNAKKTARKERKG